MKVDFRKSFRSAWIFLGLMLSTGCASQTQVSVFNADDAPDAKQRDVALICTVTSANTRPDLTFVENYLGPMPEHPSSGFVTDLILRVDSVAKGRFEPAELKIPKAQSSGHNTGVAAARGDKVMLGFDVGAFGRKSRFVLVRLPPE